MRCRSSYDYYNKMILDDSMRSAQNGFEEWMTALNIKYLNRKGKRSDAII